jgi:hypothetical protein
MFVIYVPLAYIGRHYFDVTGIFAAACISNFLMGALGYSWNRLTYGDKARLAKGQVEPAL